MNEKTRAVETRLIQDFDQLVLRDHFGGVSLWISQGTSEKLTIEAPRDILARIHADVIDGKLVVRVGGSWLDRFNDMLFTSLARPIIIYQLEVKELRVMEILGAVFAQITDLASEDLTIRFHGAGELIVGSLEVETLDIFHDGAGGIKLEGKAVEQNIHVCGVGSYDGAMLMSDSAHIKLRGTGRVVVNVAQEMHVFISGLGRVEYYGDPTVKKHTAGLGSVVHLDKQ